MSLEFSFKTIVMLDRRKNEKDKPRIPQKTSMKIDFQK